MKPINVIATLSILSAFSQPSGAQQPVNQNRPNILFCLADDASFPHMGQNCRWINTPAFDRVSRQGIFFENAYTPNAKCAPSRASILTGRNSWQLKEAANMYCYFPAEFKTYPEAFAENGYYVGSTGKGWAPGEPGMKDGELRQLTGKEWNSLKTNPPTNGISNNDYPANFEEFYNKKPSAKPFCFWFGSHEPHRGYKYASSLKAGKKTSDIDTVPPFFPDNKTVRTDLLDYGYEIEYFDRQVYRMLDFLEKNGDLENTIIIITADNGMPFPRAKTDEYEYSNHVPMTIMWKNGIKKPGRTMKDYVSFIDLAVTFFDIADIDWNKSGMQSSPGKSLYPVFKNPNLKEPFRDHVLIGKERHGVGRPDDFGYPIRGIVKDDWLYLINYRNDLWPAGNPQTGYPDVDGSPTKTETLNSRHNPEKKYLWEWSFGKRPAEELYYLKNDQYCIHNMAEMSENMEIKANLKHLMEAELIKQSDPRMFGNGDIFQNYKYSNDRWRNVYERIVINKEDLVLPWINPSDIEKDFIGK